VHMDGARFANALVALGCTPAQMSWKAGVDILSFGATKNGALACEAVLAFDAAKAQALPFQRKRSGHTLSKGRFIGAQMVAYLQDGHWLANARTANAHAERLAEGLAQAPGVKMPWPRQANEVFAYLPKKATPRCERRAFVIITGSIANSAKRARKTKFSRGSSRLFQPRRRMSRR
jgi:threonine aldolase